MNDMLKNIIKALKQTSSQDFFNEIVLNLASTFEADYVFIAKVDLENSTSTSVALSAKGKIGENFTYALPDTPCAEVADNSVCVYNEKITQLFPNDQLLIDMKIESYIGAPLYDSKGNILGITVALSETPLKDTKLVTTLFEIFSGRIAVEMERVEQEKALLQANSELKQQLKDILEKDKRINLFYQAMQNSSDAMLISDKNNNIIQTNKAFEKVFALSEEEVLNQNPNILSSNQHDSTFYDAMWLSINQKGYWKGEIINKTSYKQEVPFLVNITAIYDKNNEIENHLAVYTNLSKIKEAQAILRQQTKMASMGEMLSSITHQWKQPITVMKTIFSVIEVEENLGTIKTSDYTKQLASLNKQVDYMVETMNDFKNYLSPDKKLKCFLLENGIEDILNLFNEQYKVLNLQVSIDIHQSANVYGFYNEYKQVLVNLIKNTVDAYQELSITQKTLEVSISTDKEFGVIELKDFAGGIKEEVLHTIFNPYTSTKDSTQGTGIGLYMSKNIIENMKGSISVQNVDQGASFIIKLPLCES